VVVCPTSTSVPPASFHPEIDIHGDPTGVLCEMVGAIEARNLGPQIAHLAYGELRAVDDALLLVLGLR
jgi:mRNA-degrading endonuclease toxin of MazEF toxin-antitoxin module